MISTVDGTDTWSPSTGVDYTSQLPRAGSGNWEDKVQVLLSPSLNGDAFSDVVHVEYVCDATVSTGVTGRTGHELGGMLNAGVYVAKCTADVAVWVNQPLAVAGGWRLSDSYVPTFSSSDPVAQDYQAKLKYILRQGPDLGQVLAQGTHWSLTDLNGDGRPEIVVGKWKNGASSFEDAKAWSYSPHDCDPSDTVNSCWTERAMPDLPSVPGSMNKEFGWKNVQFVDIDGDGLVDLVQRPLSWGEEPGTETDPDPNDEEFVVSGAPDYHYGDAGIDRDDSVWYRNNGDFTFELQEIDLELPLEDSLRWTTEFNSVSGCGSVPTETLGVLYEHEYFESQGTLSDYNADGIADVAYSFYACEISPSHGPETGDSSRIYSEIFWGDGRGGFVASGLSAGKPNMLHENHPFPDTHGYEPESWTYRPHHASIDLNRSGRPELVNSRSDETLGYSKFINLVDGFDIAGLGAQTIPDLSVPIDLEQAHSTVPLGLGNIPILGSQTPWVQASTTGDFDANGFPDLLFVNASVDSLGAVTWAVELQLSDRDESYGVLKSIENPFGGVTDLEWGSSARVGDNDQLHYTREVIAEVQRSGVDSAGYYYSEDPVELRYFKGEHALGRFRGFGMVEVTRGGASTEYGYATSPFLERKPVSVASYRSDGTLESAQVNAYGITGVGTGWAVFSWDLTAPYANPLGRSCTYEVGHGANKTDGTRGQTIDMDDLVAMCLDTPNADEWVTGNGWHPDPDPLGPLANLAESIWETGDDTLPEFTTSGTSGFGLVPNTFTPDGPANEGHVYAAEVDGPELLTGTSLASGPSFVGESLPNPGGPTEVWEYTKVFGYTTDIDSDGATDLLLERVDDLGLTDAPSGFTTGSVPYSGGLSADDTFVEMQYSGRWVSDWGFSLVSRTEGAGSTVHSHQEFDLFAALDVPTQVRDCGDDPSCGVSHDSHFYYHTGGTIPGTLFGIDDSEGNATTWTVDSSGPCAGMVVEEIDAEGRIRTFGRDSRCRVDLEDWEGSTTTTSYDGLNRKLAVTTAVQNVDGSVSSVEQVHAYTRNSAAVGIQTQSGAAVFRVDEQTLDSFGRVIQSDTCSAPVLDCVSPISDLVRHAQTYGTDGRLFAEYGPMAVGSGEVFTSYKEYSGTGRVVAVHQSDHDVTTTAWRTTQLEYHPRTQLVWDALGVLHESYSDPLESTSIVAGVSRGYELRDPLGRVIEVEDAGGKVVARSYDGFGRVDLVWNTVSETCVTPTSGSALLTYQVEYVHDSLGRVTEEIGPDGSSLVYSYDGMGRVVTESFVDLSASTTLLKEYIYTPASPGVLPKVVEIDSETGTTIQVEADALGRLQRQTDLSGTTTWSFGDVPEPLAVQDVDGLITGFTYDGIGRLSTKSRGTGSSATLLDQYTYNAAGQLVSSMDADGVVVDIEYTLTGLPLRTSIPSGSSSRTLLSEASYDALGRVSWDNQGGVDSFYEYDSIGHLTRVDVGASSAVSGYVLDGVANGVEYSQILTYVGDQVASETLVPVHTGSGQTDYAYDAWGRLKTTTHPSGGGTESYEYDVNGFLRQHTDAVGAESEWRYTDRGEMEYHKPKNQGASSYVYSAHTGGRSVQVTDPLGNTSAQHTDGLGRLLQADYANGSSVEYIYSGSRLSEELVRDASGGVTARQNHGYYSSTGWLASTWSWHDPSASVFDPSTDYAIEYAYSTAGRVIESGNQHELTGFVYDSDGMLVEEEWDEKVKLFSYTDLLYTEGGVDYYSPLLTGTDVIPTISGVGLVSEPVVTAGGSHPVRVEDYLYDGAGRMVGKTTYKGSGIPGMTMDSVDVQSYDLDAFGNPLETQVSRLTPLTPSLVSGGNISQWTYDDMGRPETRQTQTSFGLGLAGGGTAWTWYADGSLASIDTPGLQSLEYVRSLSGGEFELDTIKVNGSAAVTVSSRDALGRILGASFGGDTHAFGYDPMGRLDSRILTSSGGLTSTWTAFFTDDGQLESEQISDFNGSTWTNDYTYFEEGWLKSEVRGATGETRDYTYDSGGRRTETYVNGTLERATNWAGSRVVDIDGVAVDYDGLDGVELDHLDYAYERDATGRVAEMSDGTSGSSLYQMMRDEAGRVVALDDGAGPRVTTWGLGLGGLPLEVEDSSGALLNYVGAEGIVFGLSDGSSLTSVMTDGTGSLLQVGSEAVEPGTAFGEGTSVSSTDARFAFAGLEALPGAPGVQMSQQRMYDSETGRFLSPDPIGLGGGNHRTRYGSGNPTRYTDPTGYMNWDAFHTGSELFASDWQTSFAQIGGSESHLYFDRPASSSWIADDWQNSTMRDWVGRTELMGALSDLEDMIDAAVQENKNAVNGVSYGQMAPPSFEGGRIGRAIQHFGHELALRFVQDDVQRMTLQLNSQMKRHASGAGVMLVEGKRIAEIEGASRRTLREKMDGIRNLKWRTAVRTGLENLSPVLLLSALKNGEVAAVTKAGTFGIDGGNVAELIVRNEPTAILNDVVTLLASSDRGEIANASERMVDRSLDVAVVLATEGGFAAYGSVRGAAAGKTMGPSMAEQSASKGAGEVVALGKTRGLDDFAAKVGGQSYRDLKWGSRTGRWQDDFLESLYDDGTQLRVNLDGVEGGAWQAASRSASGRGSPMDWELSQIYQSPDRWSNIQWYKAGEEVANPFQ